MVRISNDRKSGERRSARLERRTPRGEKGGRSAIDVFDRTRRERHGERRRLRQQGSRGEMDRRADRAVVVSVTDGLLGGRRRGGRGSANSEAAANVPEITRMDVAERERDLQRQRKQREPRGCA